MVRKAGVILICSVLGLAAFAVRAPAAGAAVVLNEINCEGTDWVELVNTSAEPAEISGWLLTDDPLGSTRADHRMLFAPGTEIPPLDDLVIERDPPGSPGFPFGIGCGSDTIRLAVAGDAPAAVDEIAVPVLSAGGDTWGRYPNATGPWLQTAATKGAPNSPSDADPPADAAAWLFDPTAVVGIDLEIPAASRTALEADPDTYQDAGFALTTTGGSYGPLQVGVRLKGSHSFRPLTAKAAFKLKFNHSIGGQRFLGLKKLTLNNMVQDPSMIHETLAYELFREAEVPAPRTGYAYVRVDGEDYGVYVNVETLDEISLPRWFDSTGHLYEGVLDLDVRAEDIGLYEVDEGSGSDRGDLEALVAAVDAAAGSFSQRLVDLADLAEMTRMWAVERYVGHWDSYTRADGRANNYYLHSDASGRFSILPWGTDQTFEGHLHFDDPGGRLFELCRADDECWAMYSQATLSLPGLAESLDLDQEVTEIAAMLAPWQQLDPRREHSLEQIEAAVAGVHAFLKTRPEDVADPLYWGEAPAPEDPASPPLESRADRESPQTSISDAPPALVKTRARRRRAHLRFASSEPGSWFECRLDTPEWRPCDSPLTVRTGRGHHVFRVRATDSAGNTDASPARHAWSVRAP